MARSVFFLILASVTLSAVAQLVLKLGMATPFIQAELAAPSGARTVFAILSSWRVLLGLFIYFSSAVIWLLVLGKVDVSLAYPFVGLGFILTALFGWLIRGEDLSLGRTAGTALIFLGVVLVARSG